MHSSARSLAAAGLLSVTAAASALAQQWVNPGFDPHRLDYRDLGYPTQNLIPADESQITALLSHSNGFVYGATSGRTQSYLFFYNRFIGKVRPLGKIASAMGVHHGLLEGADGSIYIGTGLNMLAPVKLTKEFPVYIEAVEHQLWLDIKAAYQGFEGGHLYRYNPKTGDTKTYTNDDASPVEDLGIPVPGNTVYAMAWNIDRTAIYGLSYPDAHFFVFDLKTRTTRDLGDVVGNKVFSGPERHWRTVPRALYSDPKTGHVYSSGDNGLMWRYDPASGKIEETDMRLPGEYYESLKSLDFPTVECFDTDAAGNVYAGTNDGYLVRLDLAREEVVVLGKPRIMRRMRAMKVAPDGNIYMITGELERICQLYSYDLSGQKGFSELGVLAVDRSPYYAKRAYSFDAMAIGADGAVFMGESDRRGKLFIYVPGPGTFKGTLNPTNPVVERMRKKTPALIPEAL
jgi:hypothetical protein